MPRLVDTLELLREGVAVVYLLPSFAVGHSFHLSSVGSDMMGPKKLDI